MILDEIKEYIQKNIEVFEKTKIESESYKGLVRKAMELELIAQFIYPHVDELRKEIIDFTDTVKYSRYTNVSKGMYYPSIYYKVSMTNLNLPKKLSDKPPVNKEYCKYYYHNNELLMVEYKILERTDALCCFIIKSKGRKYAVSAYTNGFLNDVYVCEEIFCGYGLLQYTELRTTIGKNGCKDNLLHTFETVEFYEYDKNGRIYSVDLFVHFAPYRKSVKNVGDRFIFEFDNSGKPVSADRIEVEGNQLFYRPKDFDEQLSLTLSEIELSLNPKWFSSTDLPDY